jgi:hypothetical protein
VEGPPGDSLQPEATGADMEVTKWLKPSFSVSRIGDSASVQAATRVNAEPVDGISHRISRVVCVKFSKLVMIRVRWFIQVTRAASLCSIINGTGCRLCNGGATCVCAAIARLSGSVSEI